MLEGVGRAAAEAAAKLVPRATHAERSGDVCDQSVTISASAATSDDLQIGINAGQRVGRLGIEPRTRGLKDESDPC